MATTTTTTTKVPNPLKWLYTTKTKLTLTLKRPKPTCLSTLTAPKPQCTSIQHTSSGRTKENEFKEVFRVFDTDGDGKISASEMRNYFGSMGEYMSHEDAQAMIDDIDSDGDHLIGFDDFLKLVMKKKDDGDNGDGDGDDLKMAFEMFELVKGDGCITPKGLQRTLKRLGLDKSFDDCVQMIRVYDVDRNGVIDFHEFHQMMA